MKTERCHNEDGCVDCPEKDATLPTPKEARSMLEDAIAALGQGVCEEWVACGWLSRKNAVNRVQHGESPDIVARDFLR